MSSLHALSRSLRLQGFRRKRAEFYRHLARSVESHELLKTYLTDELRIARHPKTADASRAAALSEMLRRLERSDDISLARIVGGVMPPEDRMLLAAVDQSKDKPATLRDLATAIEEQAAARQVVFRALVTPLILLPGIFIFAMILSTKVIPTIAQVAPPEVFTPFLAFVRGIARVIAVAGGPLAVLLVVAGLVFWLALPRATGRWRARLEQIGRRKATMLFPVAPFLLPLAMYRDFVAGQILTTLAVLLNSGATLHAALKTVQQNATPYVRWHVRRILAHLDAYATDYVGSFGKGLLGTELLAGLASTIRNNPRFDRVLIELGTVGNREIREQVRRSAVAINALLLFGGAALIAVLYLGQFLLAVELQEVMDPVRKMQRR